MTRRSVLPALVGLGLLARTPSSSVALRASKTLPTFMVGETFVCATSDPATFVAIVVHADQAVAFLCDGPAQQTDTWCVGSLRDGHLNLLADNGTQVLGTPTARGIAGSAVLDDGRRLPFQALPAAGVAGLYAVRVLGNGSIQGDASTGAVLDGELMLPRVLAPQVGLPSPDAPAGEPISGTPTQHVSVEDGVRLAIRITLPDGKLIPLELHMATAEPGQRLLILLPDGAARGQDGATAPGALEAPFSLDTR